MKKNIVILTLIIVCLFEFVFVLTVLHQNPSSEETDISNENVREEDIEKVSEKETVQEDSDTDFQATDVSENSDIDFSEVLEITIDGRNFVAEDAPENDAEKAVVLFYVADFLPNNQMRAEILAQQNGLFQIELENHRQADQNGERTNVYVLKNIETLVMDSEMQDLEDFWFDAAFVEENKLTNYKIVKLEWTEEKDPPGNSGNGLHERYFLCGTSETDPEWKIYSFSMMDIKYDLSEESIRREEEV